jgi:hypothetical protein
VVRISAMAAGDGVPVGQRHVQVDVAKVQIDEPSLMLMRHVCVSSAGDVVNDVTEAYMASTSVTLASDGVTHRVITLSSVSLMVLTVFSPISRWVWRRPLLRAAPFSIAVSGESFSAVAQFGDQRPVIPRVAVPLQPDRGRVEQGARRVDEMPSGELRIGARRRRAVRLQRAGGWPEHRVLLNSGQAAVDDFGQRDDRRPSADESLVITTRDDRRAQSDHRPRANLPEDDAERD